MSTAGSVNEQLAPIEHVMLVLRIYGSLRTRLVSVFCLFGHVTSNMGVYELVSVSVMLVFWKHSPAAEEILRK